MIGLRGLLGGCLAILLAACSSSVKRPEPSELGPDPGLIKVQSVWRTPLSSVDFPLETKLVGEKLALATSDGLVILLDIRNGGEVWRYYTKSALSAGVGYDGRWVSVITRTNELVTLEAGRELWRQRLSAQSFTAPLVAGNRIFVLSADRSVQAFDAQTGQRLWRHERAGDPLALRQPGVLLPVGNTLVAGLSGRLVGLDPLNGSPRWEAALATPRGTNDIERLVDLVSPASRAGNIVCVRSFQAAVGCVSADQGNLVWTKISNGQLGLATQSNLVYGSESDGALIAWRQDNGERSWSNEKLRWRDLGPILATPRALILSDNKGLIHFVSPTDGSLLARVGIEGGGRLAAAPIQANSNFVTVTRSGIVQAWRFVD